MDAKSVTDAENIEKMKEKYKQLKQANAVLKKGLLDKQEEYGSLEQQLKEKEATIRTQLEEIDHLQFQNGRMSKQMGTLNAQVEDLQKQKQHTGLSVQGFFSGKQQQEAIQNAENEIKVLRDELVTKIEENEDLHMQMYECKRGYEEETDRLREAATKSAQELEEKSSALEAERSKVSQMSAEIKEMTRKIKALEDELAASKELAATANSKLEDERLEWKRSLDEVQGKLSRWVPFDETAHTPWNLWNCSSRHGREVRWRRDNVMQFQSCVVDACKQNCSVLEIWAKTFSSGSDEESAKCLRMRAKMSEHAEKVAALIGKTIPDLIASMCQSPLRPSSIYERQFKQCFRSILQVHRKWIVYQSLVLLHDSSGCRSAKEEAQAQAFVDCLWRLHHRVKVLMSRIRLFFCATFLTTQCGSSMHFARAREALRRGSTSTSQIPIQERAKLRHAETHGPGMSNASSGTSASSTAVPGAAHANAGDAFNAAETHLVSSSSQLAERLRLAVKDVSQSWEGIGRCLSAWGAAQKSSSEAVPEEGNGVVSLLESLHGLCTCMVERLLPAVDRLLSDVPVSVHAAGRGANPSMWGLVSHVEMVFPSSSSSASRATSSNLNSYLNNAAVRLRDSSGSIGFDESVKTRLFARQMATEKSRLAGEVRQQVKRLREVSNEKASLTDELRILQDNHALLRSNLQVFKDKAVQRREDDVSVLHQPDMLGVDRERSSSADLVLTSRHRALLESLSVTSQENNSLRQHGYFIDTLSLTTGEAALAAGPPDIDAYESWELAVRKVYEQHARNLQLQVRVADGKAKELYVRVQENMDTVKEQEDAKQKLRDEVVSKQAQVKNAMEDIATTRKNYDSQLAMLTEHICTLSSKVSEKDASVASLHANKILCGHCGTWNTMGKLLGSETGGKCNTCKEKVLTQG